MSLDKIIEGLDSPNKEVRLKSLKLLLRHPDATPLQLVKGLCSPDNRNFEFLEVFELGASMRESWKRLHGIDDDEVYEFLLNHFLQAPKENKEIVMHILNEIKTERADELSRGIRYS